MFGGGLVIEWIHLWVSSALFRIGPRCKTACTKGSLSRNLRKPPKVMEHSALCQLMPLNEGAVFPLRPHYCEVALKRKKINKSRFVFITEIAQFSIPAVAFKTPPSGLVLLWYHGLCGWTPPSGRAAAQPPHPGPPEPACTDVAWDDL